ncbi:polysaccharide pyruvyl transferase family protein [Amycolatopsis thermophila]|uniref:Polysaccharide pyruvyl transferase WcaK-like protein n=1 Tax=Amycolatopsis thermophila TaxID=206084 RepID=A0ABU0EQT8_9PSEU|nr:polysaccharide pyruvyl transferase family protein [Amycolatopsis thermophila]MDQ0377659.1 polysaccharide pyruvyl transferase WcaK-like protein [Amycolatopsis thermophila]
MTRIGFFGILGSGNLGNDGSLDSVMGYVRERYPDAQLGFLAMGPEQLAARYGAPATHLQWYEPHAGDATGLRAAGLKVLGKLLDPLRTWAWVRGFDVVIVPGMGVLEATLPLRPWALPYSLLWLGVTARLTGTKVALVSVGSDVVRKRGTRWVITRAARLAHYRSFRDEHSREAMRRMGVDVRGDEVFPDLAFGLDDPEPRPSTGAVGVGVMAFHGGNDDRARADEINRAYLGAVKRFVRLLADEGRPIRLFTGDVADDEVPAEIVAAVPGADIVAEPLTSLQDLMRQMAAVDVVVATRYHNVLCALKSAKPTISLGYARKNDVLMETMGLGGFCQSAREPDFDRLVAQFRELEDRREELGAVLKERNRVVRERLERQFATLSESVIERSRA